jgi:mRNA interferase MazF
MMNPNIPSTCLPRKILSMMYRPPKPIAERDVILVYLLGNSQSFLKRIQVYLEAKERLVDRSPAYLQQHQKTVEEVLAQNPNDVQSLHELAMLHEMQDELSEATEVLEDTLEILLKDKQDCPDVYMQLGILYERQELYQEARDAYCDACKGGNKGGLKLRPAICLRKLPPSYTDFLVCGLSTQVTLREANFDEVVGCKLDQVTLLAEQSVIRLGFLARVRTKEIVGSIGKISVVRHRRLLKRLSEHLVN